MAEHDPSRDPVAVIHAAQRGTWVAWHPGDGTRYSVTIVTINEGADISDRVLLISVARQCAAFQYPSLPYRLAETGPWKKKRAKENGVEWAWNAALPLLAHLGAAWPANRKRAAQGEVVVHLPEPEEGQ